MVQATFERGTKGAGWRTSNMTKLFSHVTVRIQGGKILIDYTVDAAGQMLSEDDERFWRREGETAIKYIEGRSALRDWQPAEDERAKEVRSDFTMIGVWLALLVFFFIFAFFLMQR